MSFQKEVFNVVRKIPRGKVTTYRIIAQKLNTRAYQAIGQALRRNKNPEVPCHRVIKSSGELGGYRGKETAIKAGILRSEGIEIRGNRIDINRYLHKF